MPVFQVVFFQIDPAQLVAMQGAAVERAGRMADGRVNARLKLVWNPDTLAMPTLKSQVEYPFATGGQCVLN